MNRDGHGSLRTAIGRMCAFISARANVHSSLWRRPARRLRLSETLSLGEKRFLAVVQFQRQEFLVGGSGNSIALLAKLDASSVTPADHNEAQENGS